MQDFNLYFGLGIQHILAWEALDHILFVTALCLRYLLRDWKKVIILVTAFTIGHSITLAATALGLVHFSSRWIEFLIPLTIVATCINTLWQNPGTIDNPSKLPVIYFFALFFGLIHGLAFASSFLSLEGKDGLLLHVLSFNLGIELAQLIVVASILLISATFVGRIAVPRFWWVRITSFLVLIASVRMTFQRFPS